MTDTSEPNKAAGKKRGGMAGLIVGIVLAIAGGAGGFFAVSKGMLPFGSATTEHVEREPDPVGEDRAFYEKQPRPPGPDEVEFVRLPPIAVSISGGNNRLLRFSAAIEVYKPHVQHVIDLEPRVLDAFNSYLRALEPSDIDSPGSLHNIRTHLAHRLYLVLGPDVVRDLMIMEFVLT